MPKAICIKCGTAKKKAYHECPMCAFDPKSDHMSLVKSVYLSVWRYESPKEQGAYAIELDDIGEKLGKGDQVEFDSAELEHLSQQKQMVDSVSRMQVYGALFRFFLPAFVLLAILGAIYFALGWIKGR